MQRLGSFSEMGDWCMTWYFAINKLLYVHGPRHVCHGTTSACARSSITKERVVQPQSNAQSSVSFPGVFFLIVWISSPGADLVIFCRVLLHLSQLVGLAVKQPRPEFAAEQERRVKCIQQFL